MQHKPIKANSRLYNKIEQYATLFYKPELDLTSFLSRALCYPSLTRVAQSIDSDIVGGGGKFYVSIFLFFFKRIIAIEVAIMSSGRIGDDRNSGITWYTQ